MLDFEQFHALFEQGLLLLFHLAAHHPAPGHQWVENFGVELLQDFVDGRAGACLIAEEAVQRILGDDSFDFAQQGLALESDLLFLADFPYQWKEFVHEQHELVLFPEELVNQEELLLDLRIIAFL